MTKRYLGNIITQNPTPPAGTLQNSAAKGVWSLEEQLAYQKAGLWPIPGNVLDITDVFSTYLHTGTGATKSIVNGIDLAGEGGLVWSKGRSSARANRLIDTERGVNKTLRSDSTVAQETYTDTITSFNSDGFTLGADGSSDSFNRSGNTYATWTFRKAPKFFDVVQYTGNGTAGRTISHNLGSVPGFIIVKRLNGADNWTCYHRGVDSTAPEDYTLYLNTTEARADQDLWADTAPTSTVFSVGDNIKVNGSSSNTYVAYLFAHNDGDGGFGPDGSDIIKCGSFTSTSSTQEIDLGFEPQWVMFKNSTDTQYGEWRIFDTMRGMSETESKYLAANLSDSEATNNPLVTAYSQGFKTDVSAGGSGKTYIYMAIRRGPLAQPESGTEVFSPNLASGYPRYPSGFTTDFVMQTARDSGSNSAYSRLQGNNNLSPSTTAQESASAWDWAQMTGSGTNFTSTNYIGWSWKRAPGYFDVVAYTGNGVRGNTVSHNLGVAPEMIWVKSRDQADFWVVYHSAIGNETKLILNNTGGPSGSDFGWWAKTDPTASVFSVGESGRVNGSGENYISYLFSTLAGVSKVGSYTATGNTLNIDCGFTSGARFVLIKNTTGGNWFVLDTVRGIVSGNDPLLELNSASAEDNQYDNLDPYSAGFTVTAYGGTSPYLNISGETYIFYAIA